MTIFDSVVIMINKANSWILQTHDKQACPHGFYKFHWIDQKLSNRLCNYQTVDCAMTSRDI